MSDILAAVNKYVEKVSRSGINVSEAILFGSWARGSARPDSDIDVLVEFDPAHIPGLMRFVGMELELSEILGRKVDLNTPKSLSRYFRDEVLAEAQVQYVEA